MIVRNVVVLPMRNELGPIHSERQGLCHHKAIGTIDFYCIIHTERCQTSKEKLLTLNATLTVNRPLLFLPKFT